MRFWQRIKNAFTPHFEDVGYAAAEMISPINAATIEAARNTSDDPKDDNEKVVGAID